MENGTRVIPERKISVSSLSMNMAWCTSRRPTACNSEYLAALRPRRRAWLAT